MPPKKHNQSQILKNTPTAPKKTPKSKGKSAKSNSELTVLSTEDKEPPKVQSCYPSENVQLVSSLEGTTKAVEEAVLGAIDDHVLRCAVPIDTMASMCKKLRTMIVDRELQGAKGNNTALEKTLYDGFVKMSEDGVDMNERVFRQELMKYTVIASGQLDKMSIGTMLSIVEDLHASGLNMTDYESGCPARVTSTIEKFYGLTAHEIASLDDQDKLKLKKEYIREKLAMCKDFSVYLDDLYKKLLDECGNGDSRNPFKDSPKGRARQEKILDSFKKNRDMERSLKTEYERLTTKEEVLLEPYKEKIRAKMLKGEIGAETDEFEEKLDREFTTCPADTLKEIVDGVNIEKENIKVRDPDVPSMNTNKKRVEYLHRFLPTPSLHLVHDPY